MSCTSHTHTPHQQKQTQDLDPEELLDGIFNLGEKQLAIPQILIASEMLEKPDRQSVMTYVTLVRTAVEAAEQERSQVKASMVKMKNVWKTVEDQLKGQVRFLGDSLKATQGELDAQRMLLEKERNDHKGDTLSKGKENEQLKVEVRSHCVSACVVGVQHGDKTPQEFFNL